MRTLTIGSRGKLGSELAKYTTSAYGGYLRNADDVLALIDQEEPEVIINCAGYTNVDKAEIEPGKCMEANLGLTIDLVHLCASLDLYLVHISTAFVFQDVIGLAPNRRPENHFLSPIYDDGAYRRSKLYAEYEVMEFLSGWGGCIIRTCGLFGIEGDSLASYILQSAMNGKQLKLNNLRHQNYTYIPWLAREIYKKATGIEFSPDYYHLVSNDGCTSYEFGCMVLEDFGLDTDLLVPDNTYQARDYIRPKNCVLYPEYPTRDIKDFIRMYREDIS